MECCRDNILWLPQSYARCSLSEWYSRLRCDVLRYPEEMKVREMDAKTGASLKLTILNDHGRVAPAAEGSYLVASLSPHIHMYLFPADILLCGRRRQHHLGQLILVTVSGTRFGSFRCIEH